MKSRTSRGVYIAITLMSVGCIKLMTPIYSVAASVSGKLIDENGSPISDVLVTPQSCTTRPQLTGSDGTFRLNNLNEFGGRKQLELRFEKRNFRTETVLITPEQLGPNAKLNIGVVELKTVRY